MKKLIASAFLVIALFGVSLVSASAGTFDPSTGNGYCVLGTARFVPYSGEVDSVDALAAILNAISAADNSLSYGSSASAGAQYVFMPTITINLDRKAGQPVRLSFHLVPKLQ